MDLGLFARVLWRFKYVVAVGFVVAVVLSVLTVSKVDLSHGAPHFAPRAAALYGSNATLLITQSGFPWGSAVQQYAPSSTIKDPVPAGDLGRLTALANIYVQLANSDTVKAFVARSGAPKGTLNTIQSYSISPSYYSTAMPILVLSGTSNTPAHAIALTREGVAALTGYLKQQQTAAKIAPEQRVVVQVLQQPRKTYVVNGTKKTLPIVVFLTIMLAVTGLAFVLENLRPRSPAKMVSRTEAEAEPLIESSRRSA